MRMAVLCSDPQGRYRGLLFHDHAIRAALLVDLAFHKRVSRSYAVTHVDTSPLAYGPADTFLDYIDTHPDNTMERTLGKAPVGLAHVLTPDWERTPRRRHTRRIFVPVDDRAAEFARVESAAAGMSDSPETAALAFLAAAMRLISITEPTSILAECAEVAWLVEECAGYVNSVRIRMAQISLGAASGSGG